MITGGPFHQKQSEDESFIDYKLAVWKLIDSFLQRNYFICTTTKRDFDGERKQGEHF